MPRPKHSLKPKWAHALLVDIWRIVRSGNDAEFKELDPDHPVTPTVIDALAQSQGYRCALSGVVLIFPATDTLTSKTGLNRWRDTLPDDQRGLTPWVVRINKNFPVCPGNILLISYKWRGVCRAAESFEQAVSDANQINPVSHYPSAHELSTIVLQVANE